MLVERFLQSVVAQSSHPELIEVVLYADDDDRGSHHFTSDKITLKLIVGPRRSMGAYSAACLQHATGDITIALNDDVIIRTPGWDEKVRALDARYPDGVYLGYGNDLFKKSGLCTFPILSREACNILAEPFPELYRGAFIDMHLMDIFRRLEKRGYERIAYAADIVFEHVHYRTNRNLMDATYRERLRFADDEAFIALADARRAEADRLVEHIRGKASPPADIPKPSVEPAGFFEIIPLCFRKFLRDRDLPAGWRVHLFIYMVARYYFSWLRKFVGSWRNLK